MMYLFPRKVLLASSRAIFLGMTLVVGHHSIQLRFPTCVNMIEQRRQQTTLGTTEGDLQLVEVVVWLINVSESWLPLSPLKNYPLAALSGTTFSELWALGA